MYRARTLALGVDVRWPRSSQSRWIAWLKGTMMHGPSHCCVKDWHEAKIPSAQFSIGADDGVGGHGGGGHG